MSRPKMVSASKGGGGGPAGRSRACTPAGRGSASGPGRTRARALAAGASRCLAARGVWGAGAGGGGAGRRSELGRTPSRARTVLPPGSLPARLTPRESWAPRCCAAAPPGLAWPRPVLLARRRLSFPAGVSRVHPAPSPQLGRWRGLHSARRPAWRPPAPRPLRCRPPARRRAVEPPPTPHRFTLFLFSPFLWLLGKSGGKGGGGRALETGRSRRRKAWAARWGSLWPELLGVASAGSWLSDDLGSLGRRRGSCLEEASLQMFSLGPH